MYCIKNISDDLAWVGASDRRLAMFEGVYSVPKGVSYNAYLLTDEKTVLFDTVDKAVQQRFMENVTHALKSRPLDYLIVQHMEPDHSAAMGELIYKYPAMKIVCNGKTLAMIQQFYELDIESRVLLVKEGDTLNIGKHTLHFIMAPMVHWPEVMLTYNSTDKILFSADAFGCFGALNGALFADEVDFQRDYMDEARRYYTNIVGKYGKQVEAVLKKVSALDIEMICPLHGFVWRNKLSDILSKYALWSSYEPEEQGVMIAYASVYGNTENAAEILASKLRDRGVKTELFDVSVTAASEILSAAFRWSHLVFASTTYNAGIFVTMEALVSDLVAHNIQNRTVAIIENGSWAATSGGLIREELEKCKDMHILEKKLSIKSGLKAEQLTEIDSMTEALLTTLSKPRDTGKGEKEQKTSLDSKTMFKISYGLYVLAAREGQKDNGCLVNTVSQITSTPLRVSVAVNKVNFTHDMIARTGMFNVSILTETAPFALFQQFGFQCGKNTEKFADATDHLRTENGIRYLSAHTNGVIAANVIAAHDYGTHTLFVADVTQAFALSAEPSVTYQYYFDHIKPRPSPRKEGKKGFICKICNYVYEGEEIPADFICPICKHGVEDFEPLSN